LINSIPRLTVLINSIPRLTVLINNIPRLTVLINSIPCLTHFDEIISGAALTSADSEALQQVLEETNVRNRP
jgi:hypothetical protein